MYIENAHIYLPSELFHVGRINLYIIEYYIWRTVIVIKILGDVIGSAREILYIAATLLYFILWKQEPVRAIKIINRSSD